MFDERTRSFLLGHPSAHLTLVDRELHFHIKHLSESELEAAIHAVAHAASQAESAVKSSAAARVRPTERDDYRGTLAPPPDTALARVQPLTLADRQLRHLRELRSQGHYFGTTILATGGAYAAAILVSDFPLFALILTPLIMVIGGIAIYFVLSFLAELTGIATAYRRRRVKNLDIPR